MKTIKNTQLAHLLKDGKFDTHLKQVKKILKYHYKDGSYASLRKIAKKIKKLFEGKYPGYKACNTEYHDLNHTLSAFLAAARILDGYNIVQNKIPEEMAINLLVATLFHDTGYIQETIDNQGTGAKFTKNHVERSISFLSKHYEEFHIEKKHLASIEKMIICTGLSCNINSITFNNPGEKICGSILGTADLIGQMSDRAYLEKLLFLYYEFREANIPGFNTEFDILKKTVEFFHISQKRLNEEYSRIHEYTKIHFQERFNIDKNLYMEAIERQIDYLREIIKDERTNFRQKLKRGDWIHYIQSENMFVNKMKFPTAK